MRNSRSLFLELEAALRAEKRVLKKGTVNIIVKTPHLVVYSSQMRVISLSFTLGQKYKIT
jgi:hypothetical protein